MTLTDDLHGAVIAAAREWSDLRGHGSDRTVGRIVRTSVDSVHRLAHGKLAPTSVEWAAWCSHVGPEAVLVALADVTGRRVVGLDDDASDRLDALAEAGEHVAKAIRMAARHRSPQSDGGPDVTEAEARAERGEIEAASRSLDVALVSRAVRGAA